MDFGNYSRIAYYSCCMAWRCGYRLRAYQTFWIALVRITVSFLPGYYCFVLVKGSYTDGFFYGVQQHWQCFFAFLHFFLTVFMKQRA